MTAADGIQFSAAAFLPGVGVTLLGVPFAGTLARYLTNYNPVIDEINVTEKNGVNKISVSEEQPRSWSLIQMFKRTYKLEGIAGFFNGAFPSVLSYLVSSLPAAIVLGVAVAKGTSPTDPATTTGTLGRAWAWFTQTGNGVLFDVAFNLLVAPFNVLAARAFVSAYRLPSFNLKSVMTESEQSNPLRLYQIPGLVTSTILDVLVGRALTFADADILWSYGPEGEFAWSLFSALVQAPFLLVTTRIQSHPSDADGTPLPVGPRSSNSAEDDILVRPVRYGGVVDAVQSIIAEENWPTLFRGAFWGVVFAVGRAAFNQYILKELQSGALTGQPPAPVIA
ncbi:hypothetical protein A1Q2_04559 [Trichosporon asahii var. asahii CBS 8904]|uniref:Mitochondrial carrier protein n=1 Tax=Trichosporon asahii var. asahii (strain CBS 8904) TaxID=1220162 RepID=K1VJY5_TRIAC|nr:hypothetical protein A1Q2_04559 [Trichosporon asahii var. asahii CBS 8904]